MTELDRKIAQLKGFEERDYGVWLPKNSVDPGFILPDVGKPLWSEHDLMALDLADELTEAGFHVTIASWNPGDGRRVVVKVAGLDGGPDAFKLKIEGSVRSETICRAWIAAREWMVGKGGA